MPQNFTYLCYSGGMPPVVNGYGQWNSSLHRRRCTILVDHIYDTAVSSRWAAMAGADHADAPRNSIGVWKDTDGDGNFDGLEVEPVAFAVRVFDATACRCISRQQDDHQGKFPSIRRIQTSS